MSRTKSVYVVEDYHQYGVFFQNFGFEVLNRYDCTNVPDVDLVVLIGGSDVDPKLYGETMQHLTYSHPGQDAIAYQAVQQAEAKGIPIVGICKGAQQLCVFTGGKLHQHVEGHDGNHSIVIAATGEDIYTFGGHHQMMKDVNGEVLAFASQPEAGILLQPEVVYFSDLNAVGFQYHPEWMDENSEGVAYFWEILKEKLNVEP